MDSFEGRFQQQTVLPGRDETARQSVRFLPLLQVMHESLPQGFPADRIVLTAASVGRDSLLLHEAPGGGFQFYRRMPLEPGLFTTGVFNECPVSFVLYLLAVHGG
jgi:hypothetical protein